MAAAYSNSVRDAGIQPAPTPLPHWHIYPLHTGSLAEPDLGITPPKAAFSAPAAAIGSGTALAHPRAMEIPREHHRPLSGDPAAAPGDCAPPHSPPPPATEGPAPPSGGRLNLLLSYAGWHPDPWVDRLPRLLEPLGIHSLRATTGRQASQVIQQSPIHIAVVDLGLPLDESAAGPSLEEAGPRLLEILARLTQPPPTVVVKRSRTHRDDSREIAAALRAGAFAVIDRPRDSRDLELLLEVLRRCLCRHYRGRWPGLG